ncbi:MAG: MFS transporter [Alphaproteobacteria bacterium]|nr:MFS transporter [Alphaproteobacteria bacterium]
MQKSEPGSSVAPQSTSSLLEVLTVYLQRPVLVVLLLGFSAGLPFSLVGSTLQAWMAESQVDIKTIGLFAFVGTPYVTKVLWSPLVDAVEIPFLTRMLGRRRAWLILTQILLIAAVLLLASCDPVGAPVVLAAAAVLVATAAATQDIVIDAFRVESLGRNEQAAGMASYVAAYRIATLVSGAGALLVVSSLIEWFGIDKQQAYSMTYVIMAVLVVVGVLATILAPEPGVSAVADVCGERGPDAPAVQPQERGVIAVAVGSLKDFFTRDAVVAILLFVVLFKLADALATALNTKFVLDMGFSRVELAAILKGVGFAASILGGFVGGFVARSFSLRNSLWIGGILQTVAILPFAVQATLGHDVAWLTFAITAEQFTAGLGTVTFVAYLSALCGNRQHTATQYALLTALTAVGRTVFAAASGYIVAETGWVNYFLLSAAAAIPSFLLLFYLQSRGHFTQFESQA